MSRPKDLVKVKGEALRVVWDDGHTSTYPFRTLRLECPCASCRNELTGERTLDPKTVPEDVKGTHVGLVGHYGLQVSFSDGHGTGIYTFDMLRGLCPCPQCRPS